MTPFESCMTDPSNRQRRVGLPRTPPPVGLESVRKAEIRSTALKSRTGGQPVLKSPFRGRKCELGEIGRSERDGALAHASHHKFTPSLKEGKSEEHALELAAKLGESLIRSSLPRSSVNR